MIRKKPASTFYPRTIEDYATHVAAWASYQLKIDEGEAACLVNAYPTVVEEQWAAPMRADIPRVPDRVVSHVRWLAETMQQEGRLAIAAKLNQLYFFLAFPRLRKKKQPMPEIP